MATTAESVRAEVKAWVAENWNLELTLREWWTRLAQSGWGFPMWPVEWFGKGFDADLAAVVHEELVEAGVIGPPHGIGQMMGAPLIIQYGTEEQKQRWVPKLASGEEAWCQFFSEPNAGSDLASVQTRAVRDGDEWVVNGQKIWNSGTLHSDRGLLVARTDIDVPKHRGLSYFIIDVDQPALDIRPIKQMNGEAEFNETFFTDARVPHENMVGAEGNGWAVAMATLGNERSSFAAGAGFSLGVPAGEKAGQLDRKLSDVITDARKNRRAHGAFPLGDPSAYIGLAREFERTDDPTIRQRLAKLYCMAETARMTGLRAKAAAAAGKSPGPESSLGYVAGVLLARASRDLGLDLIGAHGMLVGDDAPHGGAVAQMALSSVVHGIQGGAEQIQRNILGERVLALPKEPQVDRDVPFKDLRVGT
ncbi:MAG: acyl-CoA dehydrogenase family protein [Acidimicrobiia bacterium]